MPLNLFGDQDNEQAVSANRFAQGSDQNCGNVMTGRSTTRIHAPAGGVSSISLTDVPDPTYVAPLPSARGHSAAKAAEMRGLGVAGDADDNGGEPLSSARGVSAAKAREMQGDNIFGSAAAPAQAPGQVDENGAPALEPAGHDHVKAMMLKDLRVACRERGLSPAGGQPALVERLWEALSAGAVAPILVEPKKASGVATSSNNYARPGGQNVGNFLTEKNTSRVLEAPGGASSVCFGTDGTPEAKARQGVGLSEAKARDLGCGADVFSDGSPAAVAAASEAKLRDLGVGADVLADGSPSSRPLKEISEKKLSEYRGSGVFDDGSLPRPSTARSKAKDAEQAGMGIFKDGEMRLDPLHGTASRSARLQAIGGHDIFADSQERPRSSIAVHKPPGGGSSFTIG